MTQPSTTTPPADLEAVKRKQQATWASGDYSAIGALIPIISEDLCDAADLRAGSRVLDVAGGSGSTALAAARMFCDVVSLDYVPSLLERGRERAAAEHLPVRFVEGDAEALPFEDASFDAVISVVGVMFAPDHERAAGELVRVCRPGGTIGLASWTPQGFIGGLLKTVGKHVPPPAGARSPALWGTRARLAELFGPHAASIKLAQRNFVFRYRSPEHWLEIFKGCYGPVLKAFAALEPAAQAELRCDLLALIRQFNRAEDGTMVVPGEYLEIVITRSPSHP